MFMSGQTAENGSFRRDLGCGNAKNHSGCGNAKNHSGCANQLPSALHKSAKVQN